MKRHVLLILALLICFTHVASAEVSPATALSKAESYVAVLDQQDYAKAYLQSSNLLKMQTPQADWINQQKTAIQLLGPVQERRLMAIKARDVYPGLPDGRYLIVCFETRTVHKAKAIEVLLLKEEKEDWQVCNYSIR